MTRLARPLSRPSKSKRKRSGKQRKPKRQPSASKANQLPRYNRSLMKRLSVSLRNRRQRRKRQLPMKR